jgi:hypothetical protein
MSKFHLTDLNELAASVRYPVSRTYLMEAVAAYQGGIYRAAIISTWIAVSYDVIAKVRELAAGGDPNATQMISELETAIAGRNVQQLQRIELGLLARARDDFEFLSAHEFTDLERLREDRHLCAHPAFVGEELLFQPSPELVRAHIVHAAEHLLLQQPVQGKSALARIVADLKGAAFPSDPENVAAFLRHKYLDRAKPALVRNLIVVLLKALLYGDNDPIDHDRRIVHSLLAVRRRHPEIYAETMPEQTARVVGNLGDDRLMSFFALLAVDERAWAWIGEPERIKIREALRRHTYPEFFDPVAVPFDVRDALKVDELRTLVLENFAALEEGKKSRVINHYPHPVFSADVIALFRGANGWRHAESLGDSVILPMAEYFSAEDVKGVLAAARENAQIHEASRTQYILAEFFVRTARHIEETRDAWLEYLAFGLEPQGHRAQFFQAIEEKLREHGIMPS